MELGPCVLFLGIALAMGAIIVKILKAPLAVHEGQYKARRLMSVSEREFFSCLVKALPSHHIFPQVSVLALIDASSKNSKTAISDRGRISQQLVDFVVCNAACEVVAVIELNIQSHPQEKDLVRDRWLLQGGIRTIRFDAKHKPDLDNIRARVLEAIEPCTSKSNNVIYIGQWGVAN